MESTTIFVEERSPATKTDERAGKYLVQTGSMPMGIVVDGVVEVVDLAAADILDTPDFGRGPTSSHLLGMAKSKGRVKILLDIDQVLSGPEALGLEPAPI